MGRRYRMGWDSACPTEEFLASGAHPHRLLRMKTNERILRVLNTYHEKRILTLEAQLSLARTENKRLKKLLKTPGRN